MISKPKKEKMRTFCVAFLLLKALYSAQATTCQGQTDVCKCNANGTTLDLSAAFQGEKTHVNLTDGDSGNSVVISPCQDYDCGGKPSRGCQWDASNEVYVILGTDGKVDWDVKSPSDFTVTFQGGDQTFDSRDRYAAVHATTGSYSVKFDGESGSAPDPLIYGFSASTPSFAPSGGGGGGEAPVGIAGLVIMIILLVVLAAYFAVGAIVMYTVKGARGKEVVPNYGFWTALPFLIKDGFVFTFSPCVSKIREKRGYSSL